MKNKEVAQDENDVPPLEHATSPIKHQRCNLSKSAQSAKSSIAFGRRKQMFGAKSHSPPRGKTRTPNRRSQEYNASDNGPAQSTTPMSRSESPAADTPSTACTPASKHVTPLVPRLPLDTMLGAMKDNPLSEMPIMSGISEGSPGTWLVKSVDSSMLTHMGEQANRQVSERSHQLMQQLSDTQQQLDDMTSQHASILAEVRTLREVVANVEDARKSLQAAACMEATSKQIHSKVLHDLTLHATELEAEKQELFEQLEEAHDSIMLLKQQLDLVASNGALTTEQEEHVNSMRQRTLELQLEAKHNIVRTLSQRQEGMYATVMALIRDLNLDAPDCGEVDDGLTDAVEGASLTQMTAAISVVREHFAQVQANLAVLQKEVDNRNAQAEAHDQELSDLKQQLHDVQAECDSSKAAAQQLHGVHEALHKQIADLICKVAEKETLCQELQSSKELLEHRVSAFQESASVKDNVLSGSIAQQSAIAGELALCQASLQEEQAQQLQLQRDIEHLHEQVADLQQCIAARDADVAQLSAKEEQLVAETARLQSELDMRSGEETLEDYKQQLSEAEHELASAKQQFEAAVRAMQQDRERLQAEASAAAAQRTTAMQQLQARLQALSQEKEEVDQQLAVLSQEAIETRNTLQAEIAAMAQEKQRVDIALEETKQAVNAHQLIAAEAEARLHALEQQLAEGESRHADAVGVLTEKVKCLEQTKADLQNSNEGLVQEVCQLNAFRQQVALLEAEKQNWQCQLASLTQHAVEVSDLNSQVQQLEAEVAKLQVLITRKEAEAVGAQSQLAAAEQEMRQVSMQLDALQEDMTALKQDHMEALKRAASASDSVLDAMRQQLDKKDAGLQELRQQVSTLQTAMQQQATAHREELVTQEIALSATAQQLQAELQGREQEYMMLVDQLRSESAHHNATLQHTVTDVQRLQDELRQREENFQETCRQLRQLKEEHHDVLAARCTALAAREQELRNLQQAHERQQSELEHSRQLLAEQKNKLQHLTQALDEEQAKKAAQEASLSEVTRERDLVISAMQQHMAAAVQTEDIDKRSRMQEEQLVALREQLRAQQEERVQKTVSLAATQSKLLSAEEALSAVRLEHNVELNKLVASHNAEVDKLMSVLDNEKRHAQQLHKRVMQLQEAQARAAALETHLANTKAAYNVVLQERQQLSDALAAQDETLAQLSQRQGQTLAAKEEELVQLGLTVSRLQQELDARKQTANTSAELVAELQLLLDDRVSTLLDLQRQHEQLKLQYASHVNSDRQVNGQREVLQQAVRKLAKELAKEQQNFRCLYRETLELRQSLMQPPTPREQAMHSIQRLEDTDDPGSAGVPNATAIGNAVARMAAQLQELRGSCDAADEREAQLRDALQKKLEEATELQQQLLAKQRERDAAMQRCKQLDEQLELASEREEQLVKHLEELQEQLQEVEAQRLCHADRCKELEQQLAAAAAREAALLVETEGLAASLSKQEAVLMAAKQKEADLTEQIAGLLEQLQHPSANQHEQQLQLAKALQREAELTTQLSALQQELDNAGVLTQALKADLQQATQERQDALLDKEDLQERLVAAQSSGRSIIVSDVAVQCNRDAAAETLPASSPGHATEKSVVSWSPQSMQTQGGQDLTPRSPETLFSSADSAVELNTFVVPQAASQEPNVRDLERRSEGSKRAVLGMIGSGLVAVAGFVVYHLSASQHHTPSKGKGRVLANTNDSDGTALQDQGTSMSKAKHDYYDQVQKNVESHTNTISIGARYA